MTVGLPHTDAGRAAPSDLPVKYDAPEVKEAGRRTSTEASSTAQRSDNSAVPQQSAGDDMSVDSTQNGTLEAQGAGQAPALERDREAAQKPQSGPDVKSKGRQPAVGANLHVKA